MHFSSAAGLHLETIAEPGRVGIAIVKLFEREDPSIVSFIYPTAGAASRPLQTFWSYLQRFAGLNSPLRGAVILLARHIQLSESEMTREKTHCLMPLYIKVKVCNGLHS